MSTLSALCLSCGLCCEGSLFRFVPLQGPERARLLRLGLPVTSRRGQPSMPLPCGKLSARCCAVYEERPHGCRAYVCRLGARLEAGEVSAAQAGAIVEEAAHRLEVLRALWSGPEPVLMRASEAAARGGVDGPTLVALAAAHGWLDEHLHWGE